MDMKQQRFGIEIELTGIARKRGAEIAAAYFGTQSYYEGTYYDTYVALDSQGREWKFMSDASLKPEPSGPTMADAFTLTFSKIKIGRAHV